MNIDMSILKNEEAFTFKLRALYKSSGYTHFKMSKFEEYEMYMRNKEFLVSDNVISFTDTNGRLLALKPDVTLSIVKNTKDTDEIQKLYYNENVYRVSKNTHCFKEIMQTGLECIGKIDNSSICEVVLLAVKSLACIANDYILDVSHMGIVSPLIDATGLNNENKALLLKCIGEKNDHEIQRICKQNNVNNSIKNSIITLVNAGGNICCVADKLSEICINDTMKNAASELVFLRDSLKKEGLADKVKIDFSIVNDMDYYSGIVFRGYISGLPSGVLSGGKYDGLMQKMGKKSGAIGFAVYLDMLERMSNADEKSQNHDNFINVALPKGRLGEKVYNMFEAAGFDCPSIKENNRKLIFENEKTGMRFFWVKPSDVAIYVERGAADIGIAGKDILLEYEPDVYELLDLKMGTCRMAVAAKKDFADDTEKTLKVATKFVNCATKFYAQKSREIDIIKLNGSIEIAPILGLSDVIVDIVETGTTLLENNLQPIEDVFPISARLIANKSNYKFKGEKIKQIAAGLEGQVKNND